MQADLANWMRAFRGVRNGLQRMVAVEPLADIGLTDSRRAQERSLKLLLRCLTAVQRADFERYKAFNVRGQSGRQYRITYGTTGNVEVLAPSGMVSRRLCAGPVDVPIPAVMLAQKLMLETRESEFLRIAAGGPGTTGALIR